MKLAAVAAGLLPEVERLCPEIAPMSGIDPTRGVLRYIFRRCRSGSLCAGFSDACVKEPSAGTTAGVGEAPRHEIARVWGRGLSVAYGDLATAWRLRLGPKPI